MSGHYPQLDLAWPGQYMNLILQFTINGIAFINICSQIKKLQKKSPLTRGLS